MRRVLVVGSTVADVVIRLPHLPQTAEDVHVLSQSTQLGGCAFNVSDILRHAKVSHLLFSPVGSGIYGDFVRGELHKRGIPRAIADQAEPNGCCYCFVEEGGERTFLSDHGAEYRFDPSFFSLIDPSQYTSAYVCGLEIEEPTGGAIIDFFVDNPHIRLYFAPGPRILKLSQERMEALFGLRPLLHLNEVEALSYTRQSGVATAARALHALTGSDVVITLGAEGAYCLHDGQGRFVSGQRAEPVDTIGAGDAHMGALIAFMEMGDSLFVAAEKANKVGALAVSCSGALIGSADFEGLNL